jgi:hypothetical protein
MQFVVRSLGRVGCDLPRLCRWRRWPAALVRREAPLMSLTPAHPDLDRLSGSVLSSFRFWLHNMYLCSHAPYIEFLDLDFDKSPYVCHLNRRYVVDF